MTKPAFSTRNDQRHAADVCREHGWYPGTRLAGTDELGTTVIEITAVGNQVMLARRIKQDGEPAAYEQDRHGAYPIAIGTRAPETFRPG